VDANDDSFVSESLGEGVSFTHTFDAAGTFAYICGIHPSMAGTVVVTE
jgi:plastocyanin